jgi:hypothetical protein
LRTGHRERGLLRSYSHEAPMGIRLALPRASQGRIRTDRFVYTAGPMVDVLRRDPPRVRPPWGLRLRRSKETMVGGLDIDPCAMILFDIN